MSDPIPAPKDVLRRYMGALRRSLPPEVAARASAQASAWLLELPELSQGPVCCFVSARSEVQTRPLLRTLLDRGLEVGVPRLEGDTLSCRRIRSLDDLVPGGFRIPTSNGVDFGDAVRTVITPGLAFTPEGHRLGYGAGYYDRYLSELEATAIGLGFERQVVGTLPVEDHDIPLAAVVTDAGIHRDWPDRAIRVVGGALLRDGKVFAARRGPTQSQAGWWELPGGKIEPGETEPEALVRELREELGVEVRVVEPFALSVHPYPGVEVALAAWTCELISGEPTPAEHDRIGWFDAEELRALPWAPADVPMVREIAALAAG